MNLGYYVDIVALEHSQMNLDGTTLAKKDKYITLSSPFRFSEIQNRSEITICVRLWETQSMDKAETQLISNLYSRNNKRLPTEWREYFVAETNRITTLLSGLGLAQYAAVFTQKEYRTVHQLTGLGHHDLQSIGVNSQGARKRMLAGISGFFAVEPNLRNREEEKSYDVGIKRQNDADKYGSIEWTITGNLLQQFKDAKHKSLFLSPEFETIDGTKWRIQFY
eukprot:1021290_1